MNTQMLHNHYRLTKKGWQYLLLLSLILNLCYTNVQAQTRLGAHFTQEELNIWRQRAHSTATQNTNNYRTAEDVSSNSPGDWDRIVASKVAGFVGARYKTGSKESVLTGCIGDISDADEPWGASNVRAGYSSNLLNSAFYYLVCKAGVHLQADAAGVGASVKAELLAQCREAATDASDRGRWCIRSSDSYFPIFIWVTKLAHAYDYTKDLFSPSEKIEFEVWLMNWALYAKECNDGLLLDSFNNRYTTYSNFPNTLYSVKGNRDKVQFSSIETDGDTLWTSGHEARPKTHLYGQLTSTISKAYNNRTNTLGNICAEVAHLVDLSGGLTKTANKSTYAKLGVSYNSHRTVAPITVGDLIDDLKLKAKMFFKEAIVYSVYEDHLSSDIRRWEATSPNKAVQYEANAVGLLANMADLFARAGDDELMLFETSKGIDYTATTTNPNRKGTFSAITNPKSIRKIMETHVNMYTNGFLTPGFVNKYGTNDLTREVPFFILDGENATSYQHNGVTYTGFADESYVTESQFLPIAKYFANTVALDAMRRKSSVNARPFPTISSSNGQHNRYAGITGFYPGQYFMFETGYNPYNLLPVVSITSPTDGAFYTTGSNIAINASATDSDGSIAKVEFYQGTTKLGEDAISPYSYTWNGVAAGNYQITAKAIDNENGVTTSSVINITVGTSITRYEAETNYTVIAEATATTNGTILGINCTDQSGGKVVRFPDVGDKIGINFSITQAGTYRISARVRSGDVNGNKRYWPGGYIFTVDGTSTPFTGDDATISGTTSTCLGTSWWGTMKTASIVLSAGSHSITVEGNKSQAGIDYIEIERVNTGSRLASPIAEEMAQPIIVYPNPFSDNFTINLGKVQSGAVNVSIVDVVGKVYYQANKTLSETESAISLSGKDLKPGIYFLKINNGLSKGKVVKIIKH